MLLLLIPYGWVFSEQKCPLATLVSKFTILGAVLPHLWDGESGRVIQLCYLWEVSPTYLCCAALSACSCAQPVLKDGWPGVKVIWRKNNLSLNLVNKNLQ